MNQFNGVKSLFLLKDLYTNSGKEKIPLLEITGPAEPKIMRSLYDIFCKFKPSGQALRKKQTNKSKYLRRKFLKRYRKSLRILQQGPNSVRNIIGEF